MLVKKLQMHGGFQMCKGGTKGFPWDKDPYELRYDEYAGMYAEDEVAVLTIDFKKRTWRREIND